MFSSKYIGFCRKALPVILTGVLFISCKDENPLNKKVDFDRKAMLTNWADNIVLPAFENFDQEVSTLATKVTAFTTNTGTVNLADLQQQFKTTYLAFQYVKAFEVGPSENVSFRASMNTYPADTVKITNNISSKNYNLQAASQLDARGFPAMDYLLFSNNINIETSADAKAYLSALMQDIQSLTSSVNQNWKAHRNDFINASGTDIGSSLGQMVNAINKDYEIIKNAKIGFPAGKKTLGKPFPHTCEAYYGGFSLELAEANIQAIYNLYRGTYFNETQKGLSLSDYLIALDANHNDTALDVAIDEQFRSAIATLAEVPNPFSASVVNEVSKVDAAYLEIQRNVVLLKTDMPSAMGVLITYQDNDGD